MLYIVNQSPFESTALASCLRYLPDNSALLLTENGVIAAALGKHANLLEELARAGRVFALQADINARGLTHLLTGVKPIDYGGFVDLVVEYGTPVSWF